jgi:transposase
MQRMTDVTATVHAGEPAWTVGIDLGRRASHEAVLRAHGRADRRLRFTHSRAGIDGFVGELAELDGRVLVVIEPTATRWQALAELLCGEGLEVRQVHAATVAKLRGALDVTGAKSDRVDARTLAGAAGYSHLVRPDEPAAACAHALCLERLRVRRERRRLRGAVKICLDTIWPEFLQTFRGGERGITARAVIAVTGGDPARASRLGAIELERRVRAAAPGRHIGHTKIKQLIEETSRPVGYRAARAAYAARLKRLMQRRALVEDQLQTLEEELLRLYPQLPGAERLNSLPGLRELDRALLLAAAGDVRRLRSARALGKLGGCAPIARDSGNSTPKRKISERCRYQLRDAAFQAVRRLIRACPAFKALYTNLRQRLTGTQVVIACANRMLRVIWRMVNNDIDYNPAKVAPALNR